MRVVAGKFRRRKLLSRRGPGTRPIPDRVKEQLFARLEDDLPGQRVADVFAGTGTIGLEALSRDAASVVFVEADRTAFELLRRNVDQLGVREQAVCWRTDALTSSFRPKGAEFSLPYDLISVDPPFRMISQLSPGSRLYRSLERLAREGISADDAVLILRTPKRAVFSCPGVWSREQILALSNMEIHIYRKADGATASDDDTETAEPLETD